VLDELKRTYGDLAVHEGKSLPYLGMEFDFSVSGQVSIKMDKYIEDLLHATETTGKADTPAADTLFQVRDVEKLSTEDKNEFHSTVASVLYMAKRARPDLLTAISFLTRRVSAPDIDDQKKLDRTLKYLNATKDYALVIRPADGFHVHAWVDASYAVHTDYKSHTGVAIGIGGGVTYAKSTVQKLNTKSSTEAEIVGVSDASGHIIWTRDFSHSKATTSVLPRYTRITNQQWPSSIKATRPPIKPDTSISASFSLKTEWILAKSRLYIVPQKKCLQIFSPSHYKESSSSI
jgi:hypothetical protein